MNKINLLRKKIAGYSLFAGSIIANSAQAQVIYTDLQPDVELGGEVPTDFPFIEEYGLDLNNDGITDFNIKLSNYGLNFGSSDEFSYLEVIVPANGNKIASSNGDYHLNRAATFLPAQLIGPTLPVNEHWGDEGLFAYQYRYYVDQVKNTEDFLAGFQFLISGQTHYGWARLSVNDLPPNDPKLINIVVKEYAYEATPNTPIAAGNTGQGCPMPENVVVDDISKDEAEVTWIGTGNAYSYSVRYREAGATEWIYSTVLAPAVTQTFTGLTPVTDYEVEVQTYCDEAQTVSSGYTNPIPFTTDLACPLPINLEVKGITDKKANVKWSGKSEVDHYLVRIRPVNATEWTYATVDAPTVLKTFFGLLPGTEYETQVQSYCDAAETEGSGYTASVFFATSCLLPTSVAVTDITATKATISWNATGGANSYRIRKRPVGTTTWIYSSVTAPTTSKQLANNIPGTQYEVQVQAYCDEAKTDSSGYTSSVLFTAAAECPKPAAVAISDITDTKATVSWNGNEEAVSYRIRKRPVGTETWIYSSVTAPTTSKQLSNNIPGTQYEVQVQSYCNEAKTDSSGYTNSVLFTSAGDCLPATTVSTTNITSTGAILNWTFTNVPNKWTIKYRKSGAAWTTVKISGSFTSYHLTALDPSSNYDWKIQAKCGAETSDWSAVQHFTTAPAGLGEITEITSLSVYPNPANGLVNLRFSIGSSQEVNIKVYDMNGKEMITWFDGQMAEGDHTLSFDVSSFVKGIYFVRMIAEGGIQNQKLIIH